MAVATERLQAVEGEGAGGVQPVDGQQEVGGRADPEGEGEAAEGAFAQP